MNRILIQTPAFVRAAKRFVKRNPPAADALQSAPNLLAEDTFDSRLRTHKLKGQLANCWASSAGYDLRIIFEFVEHRGADAILLLSVGTHDEVY